MVLPTQDTSKTSLFSVAQLIDDAFGGNDDRNYVDFQLIHAVLLVLSKSLSILERKVHVELSGMAYIVGILPASNMTVTSVKVVAKGDAGTRTRKKSRIDRPRRSDEAKSRIYDESVTTTALYVSVASRDSKYYRDYKYLEDSKSRIQESELISKKMQRHPDTGRRSVVTKSIDDSLKETSGKHTKLKGRRSYSKPSATTSTDDFDETDEISRRAFRMEYKRNRSTKVSDEEDNISKATTSGKARSTQFSLGIASTETFSEGRKSSRTGKSFRTEMSDLSDEDFTDDKSYRSSKRKSKTAYKEPDSKVKQKSINSELADVSDVTDIQQENIIIVEKTSSGAEPKNSRDSDRVESLVTRERFMAMVDEVTDLQNRFKDLHDNDTIELLKVFNRKTSLTDPVAILQLSAQLEVIEKALANMMKLITALFNRILGKDAKIPKGSKPGEKYVIDTDTGDGTRKKKQKISTSDAFQIAYPYNVVEEVEHVEQMPRAVSTEIITDAKVRNLIDHGELRNRVQELHDLVMKAVVGPITRAQATAENATKQANRDDIKLDKALNVDDEMATMEKVITEYSEKVNYIDTEFSKMMTSYQEELSQMQYDLEVILDNMAEALAYRETDAEAVAELNNRFTVMQMDLEHTAKMQQELNNLQKTLSVDLEVIWKEIERLKAEKADRDEVDEALSTKAGLFSLNGKISIPQFEAVRGDIQKQIANAYDKFNSQELSWQKHIDEVLRDLHDMADQVTVNSLKEDMDEKLDMLNKRLDFMLEVCGGPLSNDNMRQVFRDRDCLSCSTPAEGAKGEPFTINTSETESTSDTNSGSKNTEEFEEKGYGDQHRHRPCVPNAPIPHPIDRRAVICPKFCGHIAATKPLPNMEEDIHSSVNVRALTKGEAPKPQLTVTTIPCKPCNPRRRTSNASKDHDAEQLLDSGELSMGICKENDEERNEQSEMDEPTAGGDDEGDEDIDVAICPPDNLEAVTPKND